MRDDREVELVLEGTAYRPRVWGNRTARLRARRDAVAQVNVAQEVNVAMEVNVAQEVNVATDIGPSTMPLPLMPEA